jgi:hypothetical protein
MRVFCKSEHYEVIVWIDNVTRRVEFEYFLDGYVKFNFTLLSECRDDIQKIIKDILEKEEIEVMVVEDKMDYYTIVTNARNIIFKEGE